MSLIVSRDASLSEEPLAAPSSPCHISPGDRETLRSRSLRLFFSLTLSFGGFVVLLLGGGEEVLSKSRKVSNCSLLSAASTLALLLELLTERTMHGGNGRIRSKIRLRKLSHALLQTQILLVSFGSGLWFVVLVLGIYLVLEGTKILAVG